MKSVSKKLVDWKFDHTNIWHWLAVIIAVVILVFAGYCIVKGVTWLTCGGLKCIDMFQNTQPILKKIEQSSVNDLKLGVKWVNYFIDKTLLTSYCISTSKGNLGLDNNDIYNNVATNAFFINNGVLQKCMPYIDIFSILAIFTWNGATTDPKIVANENKGFMTFRPTEIISTINNIKYASLGDFIIPKHTYDGATIYDENKARAFVGYSSYYKFNINYLKQSSQVDKTVWNDAGTGGYDNCLSGVKEFSALLSTHDSHTFAENSTYKIKSYGDVTSTPRTTVYDIDITKFTTLSEIKFQGLEFPTLNISPSQKCEVNIKVTNDSVKYIKIDTIDAAKKTYSLTFDSDKSKASNFYKVDYTFQGKQYVIILTRIDETLTRTTYDYVMGVDAINCDSNNRDRKSVV